jgi:hypothetical protein
MSIKDVGRAPLRDLHAMGLAEASHLSRERLRGATE